MCVDRNSANSISNKPLNKCSEVEIRLETLRTFNEIKETMECIANKIKGNMRTKITKIQTEVPKLKNLVDKKKKKITGLSHQQSNSFEDRKSKLENLRKNILNK